MSIALTWMGNTILIDCGEGTQRQLVLSPISPMKIRGVLITHLHGDHFLGLPGLIQTMALNDRTEEFNIWGPVGIARSWELAKEMCPFKEKFETSVHELEGGEKFQFLDVEIQCIRVSHSVPALGFKIMERDRPGRFNRKKALDLGIPEGQLWGRLQKGETIRHLKDGKEVDVKPDEVMGKTRRGLSVIISGDTGPNDDLIDLARDGDVLIHEATFTSDLTDLAREVGHSTVMDAVKIAKKANVGSLILVHSSPRYTKDTQFDLYLKEAEAAFENVYIPEDLDQFEVTRRIYIP
jgi:ribonuclease Z